jgi:preprotein translocase subunit SecE
VFRLQASELRHHEEQEDDHRQAGVQQVLPVLPEAHVAQGNPLSIERARGTNVDWLKEQWKRLATFYQDVKAELQKTTWPTQKEVRNTTIVVIVFVIVCAAYLFVVDRVLQTGMEKLFKAFGR